MPISVKEAFHTVWLPTTWGLPERADWTAAEDAAVVQRLRAAGAIIVGKTNVSTMLADFAQTANELYWRTNNPHDLAKPPPPDGVVAERAIKHWFAQRFLALPDFAFQDPRSFFTRFASLNDAQAISPNLRQNILPTRERASLVLVKGRDHEAMWLRLHS